MYPGTDLFFGRYHVPVAFGAGGGVGWGYSRNQHEAISCLSMGPPMVVPSGAEDRQSGA